MKSFFSTIVAVLFLFSFTAGAQADPKEKLDTVVTTTIDAAQDYAVLVEMPVLYVNLEVDQESWYQTSMLILPQSYAVLHGREVDRIEKHRYTPLSRLTTNISKQKDRPYLNQFDAGIDPIKQC